MRNIKFIIGLVALVAASWGLLRWSAESPNVRGQDPNVETRGLNTAGAPLVATTGSTEPSTGSTSGHDGRSEASVSDNGWSGDGGFVREAAEIHGRGAALGALAERIAANAAVRDLASGLQRHHAAAVAELERLAGEKNWAFPQSNAALHAEAVNSLRQTPRADFDQAYLSEVERSLDRAVASLRVAEASATDQDLRAWAAGQRTALEQQLERARAVER